MASALQQSASTVFMVRPAAFGPNPETAASNAFQSAAESDQLEAIRDAAIVEFNAFADLLRRSGVRVLIANDSPNPPKPDAVFPNNWVSFHEDGRCALYPLASVNRRAERRHDVLEHIGRSFELTSAVDLTSFESEGLFLEGTGSMVLDRVHQIAYACRSPRTSDEALEGFCHEFGYRGLTFDAVDRAGAPIYHTNVALAIGTEWAIVCLNALEDLNERRALVDRLTTSRHAIVDIDFDQLESFAGNALEVRNVNDERFIVLSDQAFGSLRGDQIDVLAKCGSFLTPKIDCIETFGGGSVRCMMAEVFLPLRA